MISLTCSAGRTINFESFVAKEGASSVGSLVDRSDATAVPMQQWRNHFTRLTYLKTRNAN